MKSRILQLIGLIVVFVIGVIVFKGCDSTSTYAEDSDYGEYIPPNP